MSGSSTLRLTLLLTAAVAGAIVPVGAGAAVTRTDPEDAGGRLDIRRLGIVKDMSSGPLQITVTTWGGWSAKILRASSPNRLFVDLDTDLDGADDITIRILRSGERLVAEIRDSGQVLQELAVRRPSRRKVRFTIESGSPANPPGSVAAAARSRFRGGAACRPCDDRAPDSGWVQVVPGGGGGDGFTCTQVVGFSQTREWFLDAPDFEEVVGSDGWQLLWRGGAGIDKWANPDFRGWLEPIRSPCASGEDDPDRIVLTISRQAFESDVEVWAQDIRAAVETTRGKYPNLEEIVLQPVVGGPNHQTCEFQGNPVRASVNHPTIDQAISDVVGGGDVVAGASPEVRTCEDYEDGVGHLTAEAAGPIGRTIAVVYD